jgi:hypothetical protein
MAAAVALKQFVQIAGNRLPDINRKDEFEECLRGSRRIR